jgi:phospho-N-acetylmuramoyl-pentapeptide-transferase
MLLALAQWLQNDASFLREISYLTFRAVMATITALMIGLVSGPWVIRKLTQLKVGQAVRTNGPQSHLIKSGTPTMGGVLILIGIAVSTLLWADLTNRFIWIVLLVTFGYGVIGWVDDYRKVVHKDPRGMPSREKFFWQSAIGLFAAVYLAFSVSEASNVRVFHLFLEWVQSGFSVSLPARADLLLPFVKSVLSS